MKHLLVSLLQHDYDPEDIPTEDLPIGKSSVGILGVCHDDDYHDDEYHDDDYHDGDLPASAVTVRCERSETVKSAPSTASTR